MSLLRVWNLILSIMLSQLPQVLQIHLLYMQLTWQRIPDHGIVGMAAIHIPPEMTVVMLINLKL